MLVFRLFLPIEPSVLPPPLLILHLILYPWTTPVLLYALLLQLLWLDVIRWQPLSVFLEECCEREYPCVSSRLLCVFAKLLRHLCDDSNTRSGIGGQIKPFSVEIKIVTPKWWIGKTFFYHKNLPWRAGMKMTLHRQ